MRKKKPEEHENHERWLVSYADFITLLFAFFVVLYAISQVDLKKLSVAAKSFGNSFGGATDVAGESDAGRRVDPDSWRYAPIFPNVNPAEQRNDDEYRSLKEVKERLVAILAQDGLERGVKAGVEGRGLVVRIEHGTLFQGATATFRRDGSRLLDRLGAIVRALGHPVVLSMSAVPGADHELASSFERCAARTGAVARYLVEEQRLSPGMLFLSATGEAPTSGRRKAQRPDGDLELVVLRKGQAADAFR